MTSKVRRISIGLIHFTSVTPEKSSLRINDAILQDPIALPRVSRDCKGERSLRFSYTWQHFNIQSREMKDRVLLFLCVPWYPPMQHLAPPLWLHEIRQELSSACLFVKHPWGQKAQVRNSPPNLQSLLFPPVCLFGSKSREKETNEEMRRNTKRKREHLQPGWNLPLAPLHISVQIWFHLICLIGHRSLHAVPLLVPVTPAFPSVVGQLPWYAIMGWSAGACKWAKGCGRKWWTRWRHTASCWDQRVAWLA